MSKSNSISKWRKSRSKLKEQKDKLAEPGKSFLDAAKLRCRSQIKEAEAKINLYVNRSQGVADHPQILDEILKAASEGAEARDQLSFLEEHWDNWRL